MSDSASVFDPQLLRTDGPESANVPRAGPGALRESSTFGGCASPNASTRSTARFFCDDQHSLSEGVFRYITAHSPRHLSRSNGSKSTYWSTRILPSQSRRSLRLKLSTDVYRSRTIPPRETPERISIRHLRQNNYQERMNSRAQCAAQYFSCLWRTSPQSFCCTCFPCGYGVSNY